MKEFERVQIESRAAWRAWLAGNHAQKEGIWLVVFKKHMGDHYVSWDEVVEEAICFGWIDSRTRRLDDERMMLLFSPRRAGSPWSRLNKERVERLSAAGLLAPAGLAAIERAKKDGSWSVYDEIEDLIIPPDLGAALAANAPARRRFDAFGDSSKKGILWWIKTAKRPETRQKRIADTVRLAEHGLRATYPEAREFDERRRPKS